MKQNKPNIDRLYEQAASSLERMPDKPISTEQIIAAANASKSGAGIWLLSHAKELLLCAASFAVGVGATLLVTHLTGNKPATTPSNSNVVTAVQDTARSADNILLSPSDPSANDVETRHNTVLYTGDADQMPTPTVGNRKSEIENPTSQVSRPTSDPDPVVVKKTIIRRDTIHLQETVIVKDTVYKTDY